MIYCCNDGLSAYPASTRPCPPPGPEFPDRGRENDHLAGAESRRRAQESAGRVSEKMVSCNLVPRLTSSGKKVSHVQVFFSTRKSLISFPVLCSVCCSRRSLGIRLLQEGLGTRVVYIGWAPQPKGHWIQFPHTQATHKKKNTTTTLPGYEANS